MASTDEKSPTNSPDVTSLIAQLQAELAGFKAEAAIKVASLEDTITNRSFVSRHLAAGASLDEVSAAVGHSSPVVTKRFYDHFVRRSFSPRLRAGLGRGAKQQGGRIVPMKRTGR